VNRIPQSNGGGNKKTSPKATDNSRYAGSFVKRNRRRIIVGREDKSALNSNNVVRYFYKLSEVLIYVTVVMFPLYTTGLLSRFRLKSTHPRFDSIPRPVMKVIFFIVAFAVAALIRILISKVF